MASYKSQFSPPNRPDASPVVQSTAPPNKLRSKKSGTFSSSKSSIPTSSSIFSRSKIVRTTTGAQDINQQSGPQGLQVLNASKEEERRFPLPKPTNMAGSDTAPIVRQATPSGFSFGFGSATATKSLAVESETSPEKKGKSPRNVLRRKPSSINQHSAFTHGGRTGSVSSAGESNTSLVTSGSVSMPGGYTDPFPGSILGITMPSASGPSPPIPSSSAAYRKRWDYGPGSIENLPSAMPTKIATHDLPLPTSLYNAHTGSPSTRYSESPGPWSRTSTPTSMSSHSPGIVMPAKMAPRVRHPSPTRSRPPVTRRRAGSAGEEGGGVVDAQGLSSLRESLTSSSSSSTVRAGDRGEKKEKETKKRKKRLSPPPPSPPPGKGSQKNADKKSQQNHVEGISTFTSNIPAAMSPPQPEPSQRAATISSPPIGTGEAPVRPSREGTPNLGMQNRNAIPVIQSNLTGLQTGVHRRQGSFGTGGSLPAPRKGSLSADTQSPSYPVVRAAASSRIPSRNPSPSPSQSSSSRPMFSQPLAQGSATDIRKTDQSKDGKSQPSPSKPTSTSRFGLFSRRPKPSPDPVATEKAEKTTKKGPAAGTGHEGYGKYALRGRSGSMTSNSGSWARSTSASSATGSNIRSASSRKGSNASKVEQDMDGFFLDRLDPVIIPGGGINTENTKNSLEMFRSGSSQGSGGRRPSTDSKTSSAQVSTRSKISNELPRSGLTSAVLAPSSSEPFSGPLGGAPPINAASAVDLNQSKNVSTLAARRSLHRSQLFSGKDPVRIPTPINTAVTAPSPAVTSIDTTSTSAVVAPDASEGKEGSWLKPKKTEKKIKSPRKWNFFQRSQTTTQKAPAVTAVPVTIARRPPPRQVAHYALLDSADQEGSDDLEAIMHEIEESQISEKIIEYSYSQPYTAELRRQEHVHSILLPDPPSLPPGLQNTRPSSPKVQLRPVQSSPPQEPEQPAEAPAKRSRLPQVGRIPRVVSTRSRQPSPQSFSRPLPVRQDTDESQASFSRPLPTRQDTNESQASFSRPLPTRQGTNESQASSIAPPTSIDSVGSSGMVPWPSYTQDMEDPSVIRWYTPEMEQPVLDSPFAEPVRRLKPEEFLAFPPSRKMSEMSSSSSGMISSVATTAVIPHPAAAPGEDEVWNEYDDFIDDVLSPSRHLSTTSSLGAPFQYSDLADQDDDVKTKLMVKESPTIGVASSAPITRVFPPQASAGLSSPFGSPTRNSKFSTMTSSAMPTTPMSFTDFFAGYGERNLSMIDPLSSGISASGRSRLSSRSAHSKSASVSGSNSGDKAHYRDTQLMDIADKERDGLGSQMNLRFGALMTSKWLSFGRVLFSPAHLEVKQATSPGGNNRVLILDGLGNDDWSYYCALTYPEATIYNLSPSTSSGSTITPNEESSTWQSPTNHHQIYHPSLDNPFPFPKGFFTAVVFRFPAVSPEPAYRFAISESKRVLRPGGYLEISVLDLDMMNMGNRARRAVRMLKIRLHIADNTLSLRPISDNIQRMLGRRGFENLNRCMVGVPVAGKVADSRAGSLDEGDVSLSDMLQDRSQQGDEGITKMVARVGRWWYSRCYEAPILDEGGDTSRSIWNDRGLLRECEKRKTSFKLLICYAQKPLAPLRRTVSV